MDVETKFAVTVVPGKRGAKSIRQAVRDFADRTDGVPPELVTTDFYKPYRDVLLEVYGDRVAVPRHCPRGRPPKPRLVPPPGMVYAAVHKVRRKGRVVRVLIRQLFGAPHELERALQHSRVSRKVNVAFVERYHATDRHLNARKGRKVYTFSKDSLLHAAATYWSQGVCSEPPKSRPLRRLFVKDRLPARGRHTGGEPCTPTPNGSGRRCRTR